MKLLNRKNVLLSTILAIFVLLIGVVSAHEHREVGGYELTFGWQVEPAIAGYPNGPELRIQPHGAHDEGEADDHEHEEAEDPMADVEVSLQVEVTFGPATTTLDLRPVFGTTDSFKANLIPTRAGDYSFRIFGTIGDVEVDEVFSSADGSFSTVEPASDVTFPDALPSIVELLERIAELEAQLEALQAGE